MSNEQEIQTIGFITVSEEEAGAFGGYLLVNFAGRPLEFHCTTPVRPNRAQKILYGPSLMPYIYGELIGRALVAKSKLAPSWIATDQPSVLTVREGLDCPVICLTESSSVAKLTADDFTISEPVALEPFQVVTSVRYREDLAAMQTRWEHHPAQFDLWEPFERIRNAIQEAQRARAARAA
ncbi:MAG: hypothetical protein VB878_07725 [Pirellulaceae bacterium]